MCIPCIEGHIYVYTLYRRSNVFKYHRRISHKTGSSPSPAGYFWSLMKTAQIANLMGESLKFPKS